MRLYRAEYMDGNVRVREKISEDGHLMIKEILIPICIADLVDDGYGGEKTMPTGWRRTCGLEMG